MKMIDDVCIPLSTIKKWHEALDELYDRFIPHLNYDKIDLTLTEIADIVKANEPEKEYTHSHKEKLDELKTDLDCAESELEERCKKLHKGESELERLMNENDDLNTDIIEFREMIGTLTESIRELEENK